MKSLAFNRILPVWTAMLAAVFSITVPSFAQDKDLEEVITIGTRSQARSATESTAPIDVIPADEFQNQGGIDSSNLLRNVVPSYNVSDQPISDAATLVRPANLRGLAPDHTLVLVNGARRHRAAVITWLGNGISDGSQGPDIAAIPAIALKSVEVLRDGAAAQYGSDAIAGVVNFNLKDSDSEGSVVASYGQYTEGDGDQIAIGANKGFSLGGNGFINLTAEFSQQDPTDRSIQRGDAAALIAAGYQNVANPAQVWGTPEIEDNIKLWANFGYDLTGGTELYGYGNYNTKTVTGGFYYRNPTNRAGVYGDGTNLLIGDLTPGPVGQTNAAFPLLMPGDGIACAPVSAALSPAAIAAAVADPNCFSFQETITGGFTPSFGGDVTDATLHAGVRGEANNGLGWDFSVYYGHSVADFFINNTVNASLGPNTPRNFNPGDYEQTDLNFNADFYYKLREDVSLAFGAEYRDEEFTIKAGQVESYIDGGLGAQGFSTSTNG
ncbi:MAG: TonB-dependent receptor plug domain-containing protein, partial [Gammaproteobacteria bacterium]|nr:TonB-dependent receptor plug domain-containing protein [Gammaproteobacteria bacterium]